MTKSTQANAKVVYEAMQGRSKREFEKILRRIMPDGSLMPEGKDEKTKIVLELTDAELADLEKVKALMASKGKLKRCNNESLVLALVEFSLDKLDPLRQAERITKKKAAANQAAPGQVDQSASAPSLPEMVPSLEQKLEQEPEQKPQRKQKPQREQKTEPELPPAPGQLRSVKASRYIPAAVRWAVILRDGCRCTFVGDDNRRCEARVGLEFDHIVMVSEGGQHTVENLRLMCRSHNRLMAERRLGRRFVEQKIEANSRKSLSYCHF